MSKAKPSTRPFAWLGRYWLPVAFSVLMLTAAFFRFHQLGSLPPGLDEASARAGLDALNLKNMLPALDASNGYAPLWVWLQAISIQLFGHTALALRNWPAVLGTLAVAVTWFWLRDWFNRPIAWIGAFILAVSPWAVTISRSGLESSLFLILVPLTLWLAYRAIRELSAGRATALAGVIAADLLSGPIGWILAAAALTMIILRLIIIRPLPEFTKAHIAPAAILAVAIAFSGYVVGASWAAIKTLPQALGIATAISDIGQNAMRVLLMFNVRGDENYRHNLAGEPMMNAFVGLMMIAGLLVAISRMHALRYRALLALTLLLMAPAFLATQGVPNSSWAVGAMPLLYGLAAIGTYYMLELWHATFPINSAARATGKTAIMILLGLTMLHGYTQYFGAWAASSAVHMAYNDGTVQIAESLRNTKFEGERLAVIAPEQQPVVEYLNHGDKSFSVLKPSDLAGLPIASGSRQFYIGAGEREETVKILKAKFPGGVLRPHYSDFNQMEIYYTYETKK